VEGGEGVEGGREGGREGVEEGKRWKMFVRIVFIVFV
jgi:hypothetical protein